jgi:HEAT repeat protein
MYRSLDEAAANCSRNIATGFGPVFSNRKSGGIAAVLMPDPVEEPVEALGDAPDSSRVPALVGQLQDFDCGVRVNALCALTRLGRDSKDAVPALIQALEEDKDWVVRVAAITALGEIGDDARAAVPALIEALAKEDVCASAAIALGRIGPAASAALSALSAARKNKSGFIRWCAEEAARAISACAEPGLFESPQLP